MKTSKKPLHAKIKSCPNRRMDGAELRRLRQEAGLSQKQLAEKMKGWGWTRDKVYYLESQSEFEFSPLEMQALLDVLGAVSL
jgi:transcriptional regulator with XRE-family HTH domain